LSTIVIGQHHTSPTVISLPKGPFIQCKSREGVPKGEGSLEFDKHIGVEVAGGGHLLHAQILRIDAGCRVLDGGQRTLAAKHVTGHLPAVILHSLPLPDEVANAARHPLLLYAAQSRLDSDSLQACECMIPLLLGRRGGGGGVRG